MAATIAEVGGYAAVALTLLALTAVYRLLERRIVARAARTRRLPLRFTRNADGILTVSAADRDEEAGR